MLKESMLEGKPFPRLHTKAVETKALLLPVAAALHYFRGQDAEQASLVDAMVQILTWSHEIDVLVDGLEGYGVSPDLRHTVLYYTTVHVNTVQYCIVLYS